MSRSKLEQAWTGRRGLTLRTSPSSRVWLGPRRLWRTWHHLFVALGGKLRQRLRGEAAQRRVLSAIEIREARQIFRSSIDWGVVAIERHSLYDLGCCCVVGNTIAMTDDQFTADGVTLSRRGLQTLIHELAHVWQYQNRGWGYVPGSLWAQLVAILRTGSRNGAYDWRRCEERGIPWRRWNPEAQAQAVEDFYAARRGFRAGGRLWDRRVMERARPHVEQMRRGASAPLPSPGEGQAG